MTTTALSCGNIDRTSRPDGHGVRWVDLAATPDRTEVDPLLAEVSGRLVVHGTDADLAAVVLRLLRKGRLSELTVGYVPVASSAATALWGIEPGDFRGAFDGQPRPTPLIRDDSGGVLIASARIVPIVGQVYCDDQRVLNGPAKDIEITPDPDASPLPAPTADPLSSTLEPAAEGVRVTVTHRRLLRHRGEVARGRAVQAGFERAAVVRDGIAHPRPVEKWGWYRHTEDLLLARG